MNYERRRSSMLLYEQVMSVVSKFETWRIGVDYLLLKGRNTPTDIVGLQNMTIVTFYLINSQLGLYW